MARTCIVGFGVVVALIVFTPLVRLAAEKLAIDWYDGDADVLIVLGGGMLVDGSGPQATLGYDSYLRTIYASWYMKQHRVAFIVASGGSGFAECSARLLVEDGIPSSSVLLESRSHSTYENALNTKALLQQHNLLTPNSKIVVLTSDYHTWRAKRVFDHLGIQVRVIPVPDVIKRSAQMSYRLSGFGTILEELSKDVVYSVQGKI